MIASAFYYYSCSIVVKAGKVIGQDVDQYETLAEHIAEAFQKRFHIRETQTGFVGTPYLLYALSENGYMDMAYDLLLNEKNPSWFYEVNHGATTIWNHSIKMVLY